MPRSNLRERLLETAGQLFARSGYGNVGINQILAESGAARASFYHHFASKEQLCAAWLERMHERSVAAHQALLDSRKAPSRKLIEYFVDLKKWLLSNGFRGCPYSNTAAFLRDDSPAIRDAIVTHRLFLRDFFKDLARQIAAPDKAARCDLGELLYLLYSGATIEAQNHHAAWPVDQAIRCVKALLEQRKFSFPK